MTPARQLAGTMRLSGAMVRKYAQSYEAITGDRIAIIGRDGRQFTGPQRDALLRAKAFLDENPGMSVDAAMRAALGRVEIAAKRPGGEQSIDLLVEALGKVAAPLQAELEGLREGLAELPELRRELADLRKEVARLRERPMASAIATTPHRFEGAAAFDEPTPAEENPSNKSEYDRERKNRKDGLIVQFARRLERLFSRETDR